MPERELKPMHWPRPVAMLLWEGDYADISERIKRTGKLDTINDVWVPQSDDSYNAFSRRHGTSLYEADWRELEARHRSRSRDRLAAVARRQEEEYQARQVERERAKQARADKEWRLVEEAKAYWKQIKPAYELELYRNVVIGTTGMIDGVTLEAGKKYPLPASLIERLQKKL